MESGQAGTNRSRPDRARARASKKGRSHAKVKLTWNSFCTPLGRLLDIESLLLDVNLAKWEGYLLANFHVLAVLEAGSELPALDQSFFYNCLRAVSVGVGAKSAFQDAAFGASVARWKADHRAPGYIPANSWNASAGAFNNAAKEMATCTSNAAADFWQRFKRYLRSVHSYGWRDANRVIAGIRAEAYEGTDPVVLQWRAAPWSRYDADQLKADPAAVMAVQRTMLAHFEEQLRKGKHHKHNRLFTLLPTTQGYRIKHIKLCTTTLYGLVRRSKTALEPVFRKQQRDFPSDVTKFRQQRAYWWNLFFKVQENTRAQHCFGDEVVTDGKGVSLTQSRPSRGSGAKATCTTPTEDGLAAVQPTDLDPDSFGRVLGLDPGVREPFVASTQPRYNRHASARENAQHISRFSGQQYRTESFQVFSEQKLNSWAAQDQLYQSVVQSIPTNKVANTEALKAHTWYLTGGAEGLPSSRIRYLFSWHSWGRRDLAFKRYTGAQRTLAKMVQQLTAGAGSNTLVGFGNWSVQNSAGILKKNPCTPAKKLLHALRRACTVILVDEFRTSKLCAQCGAKNLNMKTRVAGPDGVLRSKSVHAVLFCSNRSCAVRVNRDCNAARNILAMLLGMLEGTRPKRFCRDVVL